MARGARRRSSRGAGPGAEPRAAERVWNGVKLADLEGHGLSKACAKRIFQTPALWLCRAEAERVAKFHVADLTGRYAYDRLTLLELRAVFVSLPAFTDEAKASWKQGLEDKLRQFETGDLQRQSEAACFAGVEGPFDPDADDAVMAPAAREVVLTPVTAAPAPLRSGRGRALRRTVRGRSGNPSAAAPVAAPGNDLMAAIRGRSDHPRPARRPAPAGGGDPRGHPRAAPLADAAALASQAREGRRAGGAGDVLAAIRAQKTKLKPRRPVQTNASRTPPRKPGAAGPEPAVGLLRGHQHACGAGQGAGGGLRCRHGCASSLRLKFYSHVAHILTFGRRAPMVIMIGRSFRLSSASRMRVRLAAAISDSEPCRP